MDTGWVVPVPASLAGHLEPHDPGQLTEMTRGGHACRTVILLLTTHWSFNGLLVIDS